MRNFFKYSIVFFSTLFIFQTKTQAQAATKSYNYNEIANHPRLLLDKAGEISLIKAIKEIDVYTKIDQYIIAESDNFITEAPLIYKKKGKRLLAVARLALKKIYYLSYSYRVTKDKKYLDRAELELNAVCNFENWNPEHFLDVGEMTMAVAIGYDWLYNDLKEETKENVRKAIVEKAFKPSYIEKHNWFLRRHSNWNSVCNAGLVYGALAIFEHEKEQSIAIIERALVSNLQPLKVFGPDGNYPEGPGYWNYGTTFQVMLSAALESALGSDNGLSKAPGFMNSANYMLFSAGPSNKYFNYYDCGPNQTAKSSMFWFAQKTNNPSLVYKEIELIKEGEYTKTVSSGIHRILPNALVFGKDIALEKIKAPEQNIFAGNGLTPVSLVRTDWNGTNGLYLGIKGGSASNGHSHMDQGTFVFDIGRNRWAMDFGLQSYRTLESKGVDLWNMKQESQRWDVFRYNNFNHNTLTINNQKHNIAGRAIIIESYKDDELGAKVDLTSVLNFNNELKSATRKATIIKNKELKIIDKLETNEKSVDLRWNMVTPAKAEIIDGNTIKLSQKAKVVFVKFESETPFELAIRESENPIKAKKLFTEGNYEDFNRKNPGTVMIGFDANLPANTKAKFTVTLVEGESDLILKTNTIVLDAPNPSKASEGEKKYSDSSPIGITDDGFLFEKETPDWIAYGKLNKKKTFNKSFNFKIDAKRTTPEGLINAGIDRATNGQLGVRGGAGNAINPTEGYLLGLDLSEFDSSITFKLTKFGITSIKAPESCEIINKISGKVMTFNMTKKKLFQKIKITENLTRKFVDVSELDIILKGGKDYSEFLSLFNTSDSGGFRISGFEFQVK
jgi:hypothetical protein